MSVAFTREESAETAAEVELPDRAISPVPNLVTASGLDALTNAMRESRTAYDAAQRIEDAAERRRAVAVASRDMRYFADRLRTAQVVPGSANLSAVAFGHRVTLRRGDGRRQAFRIVGEDEADPRNGSISYISPVARALIGRAAGEIVLAGDHEIEILSIAGVSVGPRGCCARTSTRASARIGLFWSERRGSRNIDDDHRPGH
jgi:transcription elongation GreA/GreB family factor